MHSEDDIPIWSKEVVRLWIMGIDLQVQGGFLSTMSTKHMRGLQEY